MLGYISESHLCIFKLFSEKLGDFWHETWKFQIKNFKCRTLVRSQLGCQNIFQSIVNRLKKFKLFCRLFIGFYSCLGLSKVIKISKSNAFVCKMLTRQLQYILFYLQIQSSNVSLNILNIWEGPNTYSSFIEQVKSEYW